MVVAHNVPFFVQIGNKKATFIGFTNFFVRITALQHNLLILIEPPNIFHLKSTKKKESGCGLWVKVWAKFCPMFEKTKETGISIGVVLHILHGVYI